MLSIEKKCGNISSVSSWYLSSRCIRKKFTKEAMSVYFRSKSKKWVDLHTRVVKVVNAVKLPVSKKKVVNAVISS